MNLTRRALQQEVATLQAQHLADSATIGRLLAEVQRLASLADTNIHLAAHVEQLELQVDQLEAIGNVERLRLHRFVAEHPDIFRDVP